MRCPGCNKFASLNFEEPQVDSLEVSDDGTVSMVVNLSRTSECCGEEMKTASLEAEVDLSAELEGHIDSGEEAEEGKEGEERVEHELEVEEISVEQVEKGGGRYAKSFFGASVSFEVRCSCQPKDAKPLHEGTLEDEIAASSMDEAC